MVVAVVVVLVLKFVSLKVGSRRTLLQVRRLRRREWSVAQGFVVVARLVCVVTVLAKVSVTVDAFSIDSFRVAGRTMSIRCPVSSLSLSASGCELLLCQDFWWSC